MIPKSLTPSGERKDSDNKESMKTNLPRAVREAAARADALLAEHEAAKNGPAPQDPEIPPEPIVEPIAPQVVAPPTEPVRDAAYWEHRAKTIKGMHDADLVKYKAQIETLKAEKQDALDKAHAAIKAIPKEYDLRKYFSETELETYGEDLIKTVLRGSAKMLEERTESVDTMASELATVKTRLEQTEQSSASQRRETFWAVLNSKTPDWETVNADPEFHSWLAEVDPVSGYERQAILTDAETRLDGMRVSQIFNAFKQIKSSKVTPPARNVQRMVVPESIQSNVNPNPEGDWVTQAEISRFANDSIRGFYKNRPKEYEAMEKKINAAIANKRVR